ncbi:MAG: alpha/beta hydrolase [Candidatus Limnocylindrales bacterium]
MSATLCLTKTRGPSDASSESHPLVLAATGDPSTPHEWGQAVAAQLSSAVLVTREGDGHTSQPFSDCVRRITRAYLLTLATPADGTVCNSDS